MRYISEMVIVTMVDYSKIICPLEPRGHRWPWVTFQGHLGYFKAVNYQNYKYTALYRADVQ